MSIQPYTSRDGTASSADRRAILLLTLLAAGTLGGCSSRPARIAMPPLVPVEVGAKALTAYDKNGDGAIAGAELAAARSLAAADTNGDKRVEASEIAALVQSWVDYKAAVVPIQCTVTRGQRPLAGATVTYQPEAFLGDSIRAATGETDEFGCTVPTTPPLAEGEKSLPGIQPGFYRVSVGGGGLKQEAADCLSVMVSAKAGTIHTVEVR